MSDVGNAALKGMSHVVAGVGNRVAGALTGRNPVPKTLAGYKVEEEALPPHVNDAVKHLGKTNPDAKVTVQPHTDERGNATGGHVINVIHPDGDPDPHDGFYPSTTEHYLVDPDHPGHVIHHGTTEENELGELSIQGGTRKKIKIPSSSSPESKPKPKKVDNELRFKPDHGARPSHTLLPHVHKEAASFRYVSTNRNVALESSIEQIMKESYKKKAKMQEGMNINIATPEQREDWLNVGRGAMDISDYINKYKV